MRCSTIGGAEEAGAVGRLVAMAQRRELVRDCDDDAVDVVRTFGAAHEVVEIRRRHMDRNANRVDAAGGEFRGEP